MLSHVRRLIAFAALPALSILASTILLPLISNRYGPSGWVALSVGQSIGALVSVLGGLAWPVIGGHLIAHEQLPERRAHHFRVSVVSRGLTTSALALPAAVVCLVIVHEHALAAIFFMSGIALNALSASWFFSGSGSPRKLIVNEGLPRTLSYLVAMGLVLSHGGGLLSYAVLTTAAGLCSLTLNWTSIVGRGIRISKAELREGVRAIRQQALGTSSRAAFAALSFTPATIYSVVAHSALPTFTALDQVQKAGINAGSFAPQAFVSWIGLSPTASRERSARMSRSMAIIATLALIGLAAWLLLGRAIADLLFAGRLSITTGQVLALGIALSLTLVVRSYELLVLVPSRLEQLVYRFTLGFSLVGVVLVVLAARLLGASGGIWAWNVVHAGLLIAYVTRVRSLESGGQV